MNNDTEVIAKFKEMGMSDRTDMISREVAYIPDSNGGGGYNGQITFDLSSFGQTNNWLSYSEAYIQIPYVIAAKADVDYTTVIDNNSIALKDGFHQLIDSIAVEFNQKTVVQVQNFTNAHTQFKLLTTSSNEDLVKNCATNGFFTDNVDGMIYKATANVLGIGYINNKNNENLTARQTATTGFDVVAQTLPTIVPSEVINAGRSYFKNDGQSGAARLYYWVAMATIRLSDITDFFSKMPLCKTTDVRLIITYNSAQAVINSAVSTTVLTVSSYQQISGHTCPFIACLPNPTAAGNLTIRSNVVKSGLGETPTLAISQCRLYLPIYKIRDSVSLAMIQSFPTTKFEYNDIYTYVVPEITAGQTFVHTLTTGIVNAQYVVVMPFPKTNTLAGLGVATYQSVFDTAPATTSAITIRDFNVQIAGLNVFQTNERYDWEQFCDQFSKINAINGNNTLGLTSGVLNLHEWQQGYRMYVCDVSRREPSQDNVIKSIVISGVNTMNASIELIAFVAYKKDISIQTSTGSILE